MSGFFARGDDLTFDVGGLAVKGRTWGFANAENKLLLVHGWLGTSAHDLWRVLVVDTPVLQTTLSPGA